MHILAYTVKLKNFIKTNLKDDNRVYGLMRSFYREVIFPYERSAWKRKSAQGFESETTLHMCSLLPKKTLDAVLRYYKPKTWLDVGCGTGSSLKYVQKKGIEIFGLENSELAIKISKLEKNIKKHDLTIPLDLKRKFDVAWCYEVAEHLPEESADILADTLVKHSNIIVLSAAVPGQGGDGHLNEQPAFYWIQKLDKHGFILDEEITRKIHLLNELYSLNVHCFKKRSPST